MAVIIRDLYFSYKNDIKHKPTLNGIQATVSDGSIYALLGPSGCGKTTLLDIIIGIRKPKSGSVLLYGYPSHTDESSIPGPGVGFMPQDLSLQMEMTIGEILYYFGVIHLMSKRDIERETQRLIKAFNLPEKERLIARLSGGQKRLVSLAIALIHKPRLLILDEPTVGVDPLLRISFWNYLIDLSINESVTTIITTHYIDEAKRANVVAFMRKGEILSEGNPQQLVREHDVPSLENVFLKLCEQQGPRRQSLSVAIDDSNNNEVIERKPFTHSKHLNFLEKFLRITWILIWKHIVEIKRNPTAVFVLIVMTFISLDVIGIAFGGTVMDVPVAWVVDEIRPNCDWYECTDILYQQDFENKLLSKNNSQESNWNPYLPDVLRESINQEIIKLIDYDNIDIAMHDLVMGKIQALIHLESNFSVNYLNCDMFLGGVDCYENATVEQAKIKFHPGVSNRVVLDFITNAMFQSIIKFRIKVAKIISFPEEAAKPLFLVKLLFGTTFEESANHFRFFSYAGFLVIFQFGFSATFSLLSLITEQENDIKVRNYASGVKTVHLLISEIIVRFAILIVSALLNLSMMLYVLKVPCRGSIVIVISLLATQVLLGITTGILFASVFKKSMVSFFICAFLITPTLIISGTLWTIESMPITFQLFVQLFPFAHSVTSMRMLLFNEIATFYPRIAMGFIVSFIWIIINIVSILFTFHVYKK